MPMPPVIHINLLEHDTGKQQSIVEMFIITLLTAIVAITMLIFYFSQVERVSLERKENHQLTQELCKYRPSQEAMIMDQNLEQQLGIKNRLVNDLRLQGIPATKILDDIENSMPGQVALITINITEANAVIKGYAPDFTSISGLAASLRSNPHFHDVNVLDAHREEESGEVLFSLEMEWRKGRI